MNYVYVSNVTKSDCDYCYCNQSKRDGKYIELLGTYNPIPNSDGVKEVQFNCERVRYWLGVGAQPSKRTAWILGQFGILPPLPPRAPAISHVPKKDRKQ